MTNTIELNFLNLGTYAFGTLELPASKEEIKDFFNRINPNDQDCELQWCEMPVSDLKGDYNSLLFSQYKLLAEEVDDLEIFDMVLVACDNIFSEAFDKYNNGDYVIYNDCTNDLDLGYEIAEMTCLLSEYDENSLVVRYFDYEKYGQDCRFEGNISQYDFNTMVQIF